MPDKRNSRIDKFEKRRKNTKSISILAVAAAVMVLLLVGIGIFGGGNKQNSASEFVISNPESTEGQSSVQAESATTEEEKEIEDEKEQNSDEDDKDKEEKETNKDKDLEESEPTDGHATEAYTADWKPIGTDQDGPHTTDFSDGSQDRTEIKQAVVEITDLDPDNMVEWRISNGGDQKVIATVSNEEQTEIYRVFLSWVDEEGWQPTQFEILDEVVY